MNSGNKIARGVAWTTIANIVNGLYGFVSVPILIAYFGKANYGLIGLAMSINIYLRLMDLGFSSTNVRYFSDWLAKNDFLKVKRLFQTSLAFYGTLGILNLIILVIISFFSDSIFNVTQEQDVVIKHLFYILSISAFVSWYTSCFDQLVRAHEYVGWTQKIALIPKTVQIIILIMTVTVGFTIEWYYALTTFSMFVIIPIMVSKIKSLCPYISFRPSLDYGIFKEIVLYSLNIFSFGIFQFSVIHLRPIFLGIESSPESITDFRVLDGIFRFVTMLGGSFMGVFLPSATKVVSLHDESSINRVIYQGTKYISIAICFCCFGVMCVVPELLTAYVGADYLYLTIWLDLLLLSSLRSHNQAISSLIFADSNVKTLSYLTYTMFFSAIISLLACWYLIPVYDVGGTVISFLLFSLIDVLFFYLFYWPKIMHIDSWKVFKTSFAPYFYSGVVVCLGLRMISLPDVNVWATLLLKGCVFTVIYVLIAYIDMSNEDKQFVQKILGKW